MLPGLAGIIVCAAVWCVPESPRWLMQKRDYESGKAALQQLRGTACDQEAEQIWDFLQNEKEQIAYCDVCTRPNLRKRYLASCFLQVGQQFTGVNAFLSYSGTIFKNMGLGSWANPAFNAVMCVFVVIGLSLIDSKFGGRKSLLLVASCMMAVSMLIGGVTVTIGSNIGSLIMVMMFGAGFQVAWGSVPWLYPSEIFQQAEKEKCCTSSASLQYVANVLILAITPWLNSFHSQVLFFTFGCFNVVILGIGCVVMRETKGVPVEEIPALFDK